MYRRFFDHTFHAKCGLSADDVEKSDMGVISSPPKDH
jgi:hypothetical protein